MRREGLTAWSRSLIEVPDELAALLIGASRSSSAKWRSPRPASSWGSRSPVSPATRPIGSGRQFKAWARHSMAVGRFWFSAYKNYTVDQIERQARIADGLRKATLTPEEAAQWVRDL